MSIPKEPRQLMINLMYLVLTALLALNVSAEILNAFNTVNKGISESNDILTSKNDSYMNAIVGMAASDPRPETQDKLAKAQDAQKLSKEFFDFVEEYKKQIQVLAGGPNLKDPTKYLKTEGEMEKTSHFMLKEGKGEELEKMIHDTRDKFLALTSGADIDVPLRVAPVPADAGNRPWADYNFDRVPAIAIMTILTKMQQDAKSTESTILEYLATGININDFKVDQMAAIVASPSSYVRRGAEYSAQIFVGATSKAINPKVFLGSFTGEVKKDPADPTGKAFLEIEGEKPPLSNVTEMEVVNGFATISESAGAGRSYQGVIQIPKPNDPGKFKYYPFESGYETFEVGQAVVSPTAMNVLYIGVDNPVKISVPGYASDKVTASGCGVTKVKGEEYVSRPTKVGKENINVTVNTGDGSKSFSNEFRVRRIPDPKAYCGSSDGGTMKIGEFRAVNTITARNPDFVFDVKYQVSGFEMVYAPRSGGNVVSDVSNSGGFSKLMQDVKSKAKPGDTIVFPRVSVRMPDGTTRQVSLSFKLIG